MAYAYEPGLAQPRKGADQDADILKEFKVSRLSPSVVFSLCSLALVARLSTLASLNTIDGGWLARCHPPVCEGSKCDPPTASSNLDVRPISNDLLTRLRGLNLTLTLAASWLASTPRPSSHPLLPPRLSRCISCVLFQRHSAPTAHLGVFERSLDCLDSCVRSDCLCLDTRQQERSAYRWLACSPVDDSTAVKVQRT